MEDVGGDIAKVEEYIEEMMGGDGGSCFGGRM